jgi:hypothetical protein
VFVNKERQRCSYSLDNVKTFHMSGNDKQLESDNSADVKCEVSFKYQMISVFIMDVFLALSRKWLFPL